jgi:mannose-6-phosphate isomerase-like protein (cupin superfamily)
MGAREGWDALTPRIVPLVLESGRHRALLRGRPDTAGMRSGLVVLPPGQAVGLHDTAAHEEQLVVLEGRGELRVAGAEPLPLEGGMAAYCPPHREHDVVNTGPAPLRYVYVVAEAR